MTPQQFSIQAHNLRPRLIGIANRLLKDPSAAEDAVQEVYARLWDNRSTLDRYDSLEAVAVTAVRNASIDMLRRRSYIDGSGAPDDNILTDEPDPQRLAEIKSERELLDLLATMLPPLQRAAIRMRHVEDMEMNEIAQILDTTENNVRVLLSRGRNTLRKLYLRYK